MGDYLLTIGVPCYNASEFLEETLQSAFDVIKNADDVEVVLVNDGSDDSGLTRDILERWQRKYPRRIKIVERENGGHGPAILTALANASGRYFEVLDADDRLDFVGFGALLTTLREHRSLEVPVDLYIANYVYQDVANASERRVDYKSDIPYGRILEWDDVGMFPLQDNLHMHALMYRTTLLKEIHLEMPAHCSYVGDIYAFVPLPHCKSLYYEDVDLYHYMISRLSQSKNMDVMVERVDQHIQVTRVMMNSYKLFEDVKSYRLRAYMVNMLMLVMNMNTVLARMSNNPESIALNSDLWEELRTYDRRMYRKARNGFMGRFSQLPGRLGKRACKEASKAIKKIMRYN